jgi:hypothetical protein
MKDNAYYLHQTPSELAKQLILKLDIMPNDILYEPFKGEGSFYDNFPIGNIKHYTEIEEGLDYKNFNQNVDWIITNPPFQLDGDNGRVNAFWYLLNYYLDKVNKGIAFLGNDRCLATLTPKRLQILNSKGWYLNKLIVCSVKKWRGRYFFMVFKKNNSGFLDYLPINY